MHDEDWLKTANHFTKESQMKKGPKFWQVATLTLALVMLLGSVGAEAKCGPRVDNFILFVDQSGSMYMTYWKLSGMESKAIKGKNANTARPNKEAVAKQILLDMNNMIYELSYKGALDLFAPFQQIQAPTVYNRATFAAAIKMIKDSQAIYGRETPMTKGLIELEQNAVLAGVSGKTAVIMLSDGMANVGADPVQEAKQILEKYPNVVVHVISFAQPGAKDMSIKGKGMDTAEEQRGAEINRQIAQLGKGILVDASDLYKNPAAMQRFVMDVFCLEEKQAVAVEQKIVLRGIQFDFDKYNIKPEFQPILDEAVATLKAKPDVKVVINGHTDSIGSAEYNMALSERRAKAVLDYFAAKGISPGRMTSVGHGLEDPIASNATADGRALNRRVELNVMQ
jgi:OmpA-OmpF porin, OOP family